MSRAALRAPYELTVSVNGVRDIASRLKLNATMRHMDWDLSDRAFSPSVNVLCATSDIPDLALDAYTPRPSFLPPLGADYDVVVVGCGWLGSALARYMRGQRADVSIAVLDAGGNDATPGDAFYAPTFASSHAGAWHHGAPRTVILKGAGVGTCVAGAHHLWTQSNV